MAAEIFVLNLDLKFWQKNQRQASFEAKAIFLFSPKSSQLNEEKIA